MHSPRCRLCECPLLCWVRQIKFETQQAHRCLLFSLCIACTHYGGGCSPLFILQVSLYWLVLYKLQEGVLLLMLPDDQLYNFYVTVVLAMVGQSVGLLQMLYQQTR